MNPIPAPRSPGDEPVLGGAGLGGAGLGGAGLGGAAGWEPANEAEAAMARAVAAGDEVAYLAAVNSGPLLLPLVEPVRGPQDLVRWPTLVADGTRYVLAFTSRAAMPASARADLVRVSPLFDLAEVLAGYGYGLLVDPGRPVQVPISPAALAALAPWEAVWSSREAALRAATREERPEAYVSALLDGALLLPLPHPGDAAAGDGGSGRTGVPRPGDYWSAIARSDPEDLGWSRDVTDPEFPWWRTERSDGRPLIVAFTTPVHLLAEVGERDWVEVPAVDVVAAWSDPECGLRINPGAATGTELSGTALAAMREAYARALRERSQAEAPGG